MSILELPSDPYQLAAPRVGNYHSDSWDGMPEDYNIIVELDYAAEELGFLNESYFISAYSGFILPMEHDPKEKVKYSKCDDVLFEGKFTNYSKVHIGRIIGVGAVRAFCLTFDRATIIPSFCSIDETEFLHVPVLAVKSIVQVN